MPGYNDETLGLKTAKAWGLTPQQWRAQPADDQALMTAFELFEGTREAYRDEFREAYHKKASGEGDREFRAMQRQKNLDKRGMG